MRLKYAQYIKKNSKYLYATLNKHHIEHRHIDEKRSHAYLRRFDSLEQILDYYYVKDLFESSNQNS